MRFRLTSTFHHFLNSFCRRCSQTATARDPAAYFFSQRVQELLFQLNDRDHDKVFQPRKLGQEIQAPQYRFMTEDELHKERERIGTRLREKLQVPPMLSPRRPIERVLAEDKALAGLIQHKLACVDISADRPDRKRLITVREPDGTLRTATWDERVRLSQIFLPAEGRNVTMPKMFEEPYLSECLDREDYVMVLDRACLQFEPDDPDYLRVTSATYDHVDTCRRYDVLQSTRHIGALAFYLAWHRRIDNMLLHLIQRERLDQAVKLIELYHVLRSPEPISDEAVSARAGASQSGIDTSSDSDSASDSDSDVEEASIETIRDYIENSSVKRPVLELALQKYQQLSAGRRRVEREQSRADGRQ